MIFITLKTASDTIVINPLQVNSLKQTPVGVQVGLGARLLILPDHTVTTFLELINGRVQDTLPKPHADVPTL